MQWLAAQFLVVKSPFYLAKKLARWAHTSFGSVCVCVCEISYLLAKKLARWACASSVCVCVCVCV